MKQYKAKRFMHGAKRNNFLKSSQSNSGRDLQDDVSDTAKSSGTTCVCA